MNLLIDANIVLDVLQKREPHYNDSALIWKLCETGHATGYITTLAFADLVYIMRKELYPEKIEEIREKLSMIFSFADFTGIDLANASKMKWDDYEDAVQSTIAERIHADYIITRNIRDYTESKIVALTPGELINRVRVFEEKKC